MTLLKDEMKSTTQATGGVSWPWTWLPDRRLTEERESSEVMGQKTICLQLARPG